MTLVVFVVIYNAAILLFFLAIRKVSQWKNKVGLLDRIASRYKAHVITPADSYPYVLVRLNRRTYKVSLHATDQQQQRFLKISARWIGQPNDEVDSDPFRMLLTAERVTGRFAELGGEKDIAVGNPEFDRRFYVQSNNEKVLAATLTSQCQNLIQKLGHPLDKRFELRVVGEHLQFCRGVNRLDDPSIFVMIRLFADLHLHLSMANEVAYAVDVGKIELTGATTCLICGELVGERKVQCGTCLTEFHQDCWEYLGRCGRFACESSGPDNSTEIVQPIHITE